MSTPTQIPFSFGKTYVKMNTTIPTTEPVLGAEESPRSTFDPDFASGGNGWTGGTWEDMSKNITGVSYTIDLGMQRQWTGSTDGSATRAYRTRFVQTITLTHLFDDSTYANNGTSWMLNYAGSAAGAATDEKAIIIGNMQNVAVGAEIKHGFAWGFPKCSLIGLTEPTGNPRTFSSTWRVNHVTTAAPLYSSYIYHFNGNNVAYCA